MSLVPYVNLLKFAKEHKITIPAMNTFNMESAQAVVEAADEMNTPIIVQVFHKDLLVEGAEYAVAIVAAAAKKAKVMVALGLDHGSSVEQALHCVDCGFSGVMIDLASQDYEFNVCETRRVVEYAHARGVSVEAELGTIKSGMDSLAEIAAGYTDPEVARKFVKDTGVDCLAVSIGTAHGMYKHTPEINFDLLQELIKTVSCPIVVHGGSGIPDGDVAKMVSMGMAKFNIGTDLYNAYREVIKELLNKEDKIRPSVLVERGRESIKKVALHKIEVLTRYRV